MSAQRITRTTSGGAAALALAVVLALAGGCAGHLAPTGEPAASAARASYIVQAESLEAARLRVAEAGGRITHELGIIRAVGAELTPAQAAAVASAPGVRSLFGNHEVRTEAVGPGAGGDPLGNGNTPVETYYPTVVGARNLHGLGVDGQGVTIATVDTGLWKKEGLTELPGGRSRVLVGYDAITDSRIRAKNVSDPSGHGSHISSIAFSSLETLAGNYNGIAPRVDVVPVRAFDSYGAGTYLDVIRGIDWVVANASRYGIRVLNLSFSATPRSWYWEDPLNQAVMAAWQAGIVVVTSAGNGGPLPMTVGVPGNVPYVITVGAMTDNYTPINPLDDRLATFSAAGPTYEGFVKPDLVAPGGHMLGLMSTDSQLAKSYPAFHDGGQYFVMSGTSQAAALVSGVVALMLEESPELTPDEVKHRLLATARPAVRPLGGVAYSVFQQGAGQIDAYRATRYAALGLGDTYASANDGLDVAKDLAGVEHYGGPANRAADGSYYLMNLEGDGYLWDGSAPNSTGYLWSDGFVWPDGYIWSDGYLWSDGVSWFEGNAASDGYLWSDAYMWPDSYLWSDTLVEPMTVNVWVDHQ